MARNAPPRADPLPYVFVALLSTVGAATGLAGPAPAAPSRPRLVLQSLHSKAVASIVFSADGRLLLTSSPDDTTRVHEAATGRELHRFEGSSRSHPTRTTGAAAFSPDGRRVAVLGDDAEIRVYDTVSGTELARLTGDTPYTAVAFAAGGIVAGTTGGELDLYVGPAKSRPRRATGGGSSPVVAIATTAAGGAFFTASSAEPVRRWSAAGAVQAQFPTTSGAITDLAVSADGGVLVTGSSTGSVAVWDTRRPSRPVRSFSTSSPVADVDVSFDGTTVAAVDSKGRLAAWDDAGTPAPAPVVEADGVLPGAVAISPDSTTLAIGTNSGGILLRPVFGRAGRRLGAEPAGLVATRPVFSPDGGHLAFLDAWGATVFRTDTGRPEARVGSTLPVALVGDEARLVVADPDGTLRVRDLVSGRSGRPLGPPVPGLRSLVASNDGTLLAAGDVAGNVHLRDLATGASRGEFRALASAVTGVTFSADARRLLAWSDQGTAAVLDASGGRVVATATGSFATRTLDLSPDGEHLAVRVTDFSLEVRRVGAASVVRIPDPRAQQPGDAPTQAITTIAFSADGARLVTGSWDKTARVWDTRTGRRLATLAGHSSDLLDARFSPDGRFVVTTSHDRTARVFDAATGRSLGVLALDKATSERTDPPAFVVGDDDGRFDEGGSAGPFTGHYVVGERTFDLGAFERGFRDPGLLAAILARPGARRRPLDAVPAGAPPIVVITPTDGALGVRVDVTNAGGGIGHVAVELNGSRVTDDARPTTFAPNAKELRVDVDLAGDRRLRPGEENTIEVTAYDSSGSATTRGRATKIRPPGERLGPPELWAVVCGVSEFAGPELNLRFAAKDATDFAAALRLGADAQFGAERVHVALCASPATAGGAPATRAAVLAAFDGVKAKAKGNDVLVVYLAGHGVVDEPGGDYRFLTADVASAALDDPATRAKAGLSGRELTARIRDAGAVGGQILILDTCSAGSVGAAVRASYETSRTPEGALRRIQAEAGRGLFVLAGCAGDRKAYESDVYDQGLLTYSLLFGLSCGCHFKDDVLVDVGMLSTFACDLVPRLASEMKGGGTRQVPVLIAQGESFVVGRLDDEARAKVPLRRAKPLIVRSSLVRRTRPTDELRLSKAVDAAVREMPPDGSGRSPIGFVDSDRMPGAFRIVGHYAADDGGASLHVDVVIYRIPDDGEEAEVATFAVTGASKDLPALARDLVARAADRLLALPR